MPRRAGIPSSLIGLAFALVAIALLCAALIFERWGPSLAEMHPDPKSARAAETRWVDSFVEPFYAAKSLAVFLEGPAGKHPYYRPLLAIGSRLANQADQVTQHGVPPGWNDLASGLHEKSGDLVQLYAQLPRLRAHCVVHSVEILGCDTGAPIFQLNGEPLTGVDVWTQVYITDESAVSPALMVAGTRDPDLDLTSRAIENGMATIQRSVLRMLAKSNHGAAPPPLIVNTPAPDGPQSWLPSPGDSAQP